MSKQSSTSAESIFKDFNNLTILVIGDVMIDSYLWGKVERISPEAPVPIVNVENREIRLGGAANVALNIQSLGATPIICSVIGDDTDGENLISLLKDNNLTTKGIVRSDERITTIKHRIISGGHHILRVDQETDKEISAHETSSLFSKIEKLLEEVDAIIFEDYDKGVLHESLISDIITKANSLNIPTIVDPKKRNFLFYKGATLFKPNRKEMKEGLKLDHDLKTLEEIEASVEKLQAKLNVSSILITLSEKGVYFQKEKEKIHLPAHVRKISDVSGAGDTVVSVAALCVALKLPSSTTAQLSNLAGGLVCEQVGVIPIEKELLLSEAKKLGM